MRSLEIDLRFDGGKVRVKRATGASERRTVQAMERMLRTLWDQPERRDLVREVADNKRNLIDLYHAFVTGQLSAAFEDQAFETLRDEWLATFQASASHKHRIKQSFATLVAQQRRTVQLSDLPTLLEQYRTQCVAANTPRALNYAKNACRSFLRDTLGTRHPLYADVKDVPGMTEAKDGVLGITVEEARAVRQRLERMAFHPRGAKRDDKIDRTTGPHAARIWWAMCCTGMGATEYWGAWEVLPDRIRIKGTKRPGRRWGTLGREVPIVVTPVQPEITADRFAKLVAKAGSSPYVGRHSYGCWMEDAEIPRTRREMYLGHGVKDVTAKYERREITAFLQEDRDRLLKVLGTEPTLALMKSQGLVVGQMAQEAG